MRNTPSHGLTPAEERLADAVSARVAGRLRPIVPQLLTKAEVRAERLRVDPSWVGRHKAELGAIKLGDHRNAELRFDPARVAEYLAAGQTGRSPRAAESPAAKPKARRRRRAGSGADLGLAPLSRRRDGRIVSPTERQLANLVDAPPAPPGNTRAMKHGAYAAIARVDDKVREVFDAIADDVPLRERDGGLPAADTVIVQLLAEALVRRAGIAEYLAREADAAAEEKRPPRLEESVLNFERRLRQEAARYADQLGMTPQSRSRIGLDLARTGAAVGDLSSALSERDPAKRKEMLLALGRGDLVDEGGAE